MSLDKVLTKLNHIEEYINDVITNENTINYLDNQFNDLWTEITNIQDNLIDIEHRISKLTY